MMLDDIGGMVLPSNDEPEVTIEQNYSDIADAIREKDGSSEGMTPLDMPSKIRAIPTGGSSDPVNNLKPILYILPESTDQGENFYPFPECVSQDEDANEEWEELMTFLNEQSGNEPMGNYYPVCFTNSKQKVSSWDYRTRLCYVIGERVKDKGGNTIGDRITIKDQDAGEISINIVYYNPFSGEYDPVYYVTTDSWLGFEDRRTICIGLNSFEQKYELYEDDLFLPEWSTLGDDDGSPRLNALCDLISNRDQSIQPLQINLRTEFDSESQEGLKFYRATFKAFEYDEEENQYTATLEAPEGQYTILFSLVEGKVSRYQATEIQIPNGSSPSPTPGGNNIITLNDNSFLPMLTYFCEDRIPYGQTPFVPAGLTDNNDGNSIFEVGSDSTYAFQTTDKCIVEFENMLTGSTLDNFEKKMVLVIDGSSRIIVDNFYVLDNAIVCCDIHFVGNVNGRQGFAGALEAHLTYYKRSNVPHVKVDYTYGVNNVWMYEQVM